MKDDNTPIIIENLLLPYIKKNINLRFNRGVNYIRGNNGTGKTLLLDYISGIRHDKKASVTGNESIVYINQSIFFSDRLICQDFLKFVYRLNGGKKKVSDFYIFAEKYYEQNWGKKELDKLLKKQWGMLSGGEKKFAYIMILLSIEREWYILDEPFAFLDVWKKHMIWKIIEGKKSENKGIIITSHEDEREYEKNFSNTVDMNLFV